ncbi:MAG TPA: hypothetical protein PK598_04465 [Thermoanaerobaculia bacterium]|nr:hypothetical protein [Thermoanaerobaculia bacterium]
MSESGFAIRRFSITCCWFSPSGFSLKKLVPATTPVSFVELPTVRPNLP